MSVNGKVSVFNMANMSPLFSVIMPAYNSGQYVKTSLESLFAQVCRDFEIIFIDDGSNDDVATVAMSALKEWGRAFTFISQDNQGAGKSKNRGISFAKCEYLYFLDTDDVAQPYLLSRISKEITAKKSDIVATGWKSIDERGKDLPGESPDFSSIPGRSDDPLIRIVQYLRFDIPIWIGGFAARRSFVDVCGIKFFTSLPVHDDTFFISECLFFLSSFKMIPDILVSYRRRAGSITQRTNYRSLANRAEFHLAREINLLLSKRGDCPCQVLDFFDKKERLNYLDRLKFFIMEGRCDLFYKALKEPVFHRNLSGLMHSKGHSCNDRFKSLLALYFTSFFALRYRRKFKDQLAKWNDDCFSTGRV